MRTPEAITAINGDALKDRGASTLADLTDSVPNMSFTSNFGVSQVFIRGIGNNFFSPGGDPGVAFYSDGAYVSDPETTSVSLFDVARVEVLRGPQGALYGRNATGGAINVLSAAPTSDFRAQAGILLGDYGRKESEGFVSGPVGNSATEMRLSYQVKSLDGYTPNELAGQAGAPAKLDDLNAQALRLQSLTYLPNDARLRLIGSYYMENDNGQAEKVLPESYALPAELLYGAKPSSDPRSLKSQFASNSRRIGSLLSEYEQPIDGNELTVVASLRTNSRQVEWDQDGTEANQASTKVDTYSHDFSIDARLASGTKDKLHWLMGATYLNFTDHRVTNVDIQAPLGFLVPGAPLNIAAPVPLVIGGDVRTTSYAIYGDWHYALAPTIALNAGLRANNDQKSAEEFQQVGTRVSASPEANWSSVPAKLGIEVQLDSDSMTYANLARGFKSGAINLGALQSPVKPETVTSFEVGFKSSFMQHRGTFALAAFTSDYRDMQILQIGTVDQVLSSADKTQINGLEVETQIKPMKNLTLNASLGLLDARFDEFVTPDVRHGSTATDVSGNQLPTIAKTQASLGLELAQTWNGNYTATERIDYTWRDKVYFTEFNTEDAMQGAYGIVNLSAAIQPFDAKWKLYGYVQNLTDVYAISSMSIVSPLLGSMRLVNLIPPRHIGVGMTFNF